VFVERKHLTNEVSTVSKGNLQSPVDETEHLPAFCFRRRLEHNMDPSARCIGGKWLRNLPWLRCREACWKPVSKGCVTMSRFSLCRHAFGCAGGSLLSWTFSVQLEARNILFDDFYLHVSNDIRDTLTSQFQGELYDMLSYSRYITGLSSSGQLEMVGNRPTRLSSSITISEVPHIYVSPYGVTLVSFKFFPELSVFWEDMILSLISSSYWIGAYLTTRSSNLDLT